MTSTLSPADTGETYLPAHTLVGEATQRLRPPARRPDATVEFPLFRGDGFVAGVDTVLDPGLTLTLPAFASPPPPPLRRAAPTTYSREVSTPLLRRGAHRRPVPLWMGVVVGYGSALVSMAAVVAALLAVR